MNTAEAIKAAIFATPDEHLKSRDILIHNITAALSASAEQPLTDSYVQIVPDKCDRIVWRNAYYHLPIAHQASQPVALTDEQKWNRFVGDRAEHSIGAKDAFLQALALSATSQPSESEPDLSDIENKITQYGLCKWRGDPRGQSAYLRKEIMDAIRALTQSQEQQAPAQTGEKMIDTGSYGPNSMRKPTMAERILSQTGEKK